MINKVAALFFILIANIILLANAAIPHHHHKSEVCIVGSHCKADEHKTDGHKHGHDGDNNADHCVLNQVFIIPANQVKQEIKSLDFSDNTINHNQFQANPIDLELISLVSIYLLKTQPSLLFSSYCRYVQSSLGMRAPPIV